MLILFMISIYKSKSDSDAWHAIILVRATSISNKHSTNYSTFEMHLTEDLVHVL